MGLEEDFAEAAANVKKLTKTPSDDELREIYGLYKQATVGDVNISEPSVVDIRAKVKWGAWHALKGMERSEAKKQYVKYASKLMQKYGAN